MFMNVCQLESKILCALPRGQRKECRKVFTVRAPWEERTRIVMVCSSPDLHSRLITADQMKRPE
jgi:hypothetical protein